MKKYFLLSVLLIMTHLSFSQLSPNGLLFDGVDDKLIIPNNTAYNIGTGEFTVEVWLRADAASGSNIWEYIVSQSLSPSSAGISLSIAYNGKPSFSINGSGWSPAAAVNLRDGVCHHVAFVRKDTVMTCYLDGAALNGTQVVTTAINSSNPLCIGAYNSGTGSQSPFKGLIKELRYWNIARTQLDLLSNLNTVISGSSSGLIGYWRMNASSGQTVTDFSPVANNGNLGNTSAVETYDPAFSTGCPSCTQTTAVVTAGGPTSFCIGDSVLLSANTGLNFQYQWYNNGVAIAGATGATIYAKLSGVYTVRLTNSGGCSSTSNGIQINQLLDNAGYISCSGVTVGTWACMNGGNTRTLSVNTGPGYLYQWQRNGINMGGLTGNTLSTSLDGVYTCIVTTGGCSRTTSSFTLGANPVTLISTGPTTMCSGPVFLLATRTYGNSSGVTYDWKLNGVSIGAPNSYTYNAFQSGSFTCTVTDAICPGTVTSNGLAVSLGTLPNVNIGPGSFQTISECISSQLILSAENTLGDPYDFNDPAITAVDWYKDGLLYQNSANSIPVMESGVYSLYISSTSCGTIASPPKVVLMTNAISPPQISHGNLTNCTQVALSVPNYWFGFQWKLNGVVIPGAISSNYTATQTGSYTCQLSNSCGSVTTAAVQVTITGGVAPVISAPNGTVICGGANKVLVAPTGTGFTYQWKLNGSNLANGNLNAYYTNVPGNYTCMITASCGSQLSNTISLTAGPAIPAVPGYITGTAIPCPGTNNITYSISPVAGATTYNWVLPTGYSLVSGQGTNSIVTNVGTSFTGGNIQVASGNVCGNSSFKSKVITSKFPAAPASISGKTTGVCASTQIYNVASVPNASYYKWTLPTGATIASGQGTTSLSVNFSSTYNLDTINVIAKNTCGSSAATKLVVKAFPAIPTVISGSTSVCAGQQALNYSIAPVYGATSYTWTKPSGSTITSGQGTTQIVLTMGASSGDLKVKGVNVCSAGFNKSLSLSVVCRELSSANNEEILISPNPFSGTFNVHIDNPGMEEVSGIIYNSAGQAVEYFTMKGNDSGPLGAILDDGFYIVRVVARGETLITRIIKSE